MTKPASQPQPFLDLGDDLEVAPGVKLLAEAVGCGVAVVGEGEDVPPLPYCFELGMSATQDSPCAWIANSFLNSR